VFETWYKQRSIHDFMGIGRNWGCHPERRRAAFARRSRRSPLL